MHTLYNLYGPFKEFHLTVPDHDDSFRRCFPNDLTNLVTRDGLDPVTTNGFTDIYRGMLQYDGLSVKVAIKTFKFYSGKDSDFSKKKERLRRAMEAWQNLKHVNVLPLLGTTMGFGRFAAMVSPWMENGTLTKYLENHYDSLSTIELLGLLNNVASGLEYLHSRSVVHGGLSGSNILVCENGRAYISDFGLQMFSTKFGGSTFATVVHPRGTLRWTAPELLDLEVPKDNMDKESPCTEPTTQSDVYSFGSIMLQILSGKVPYHYYTHEVQVVHAVSRGMQPRRPISMLVTERRWMFIQLCWSSVFFSWCLRPSSEEIVEFVEQELVEPHQPRDDAALFSRQSLSLQPLSRQSFSLHSVSRPGSRDSDSSSPEICIEPPSLPPSPVSLLSEYAPSCLLEPDAVNRPLPVPVPSYNSPQTYHTSWPAGFVPYPPTHGITVLSEGNSDEELDDLRSSALLHSSASIRRPYCPAPHVAHRPYSTSPLLASPHVPVDVHVPSHENRTPSSPLEPDEPEIIHPMPITSPIQSTHSISVSADEWIPIVGYPTSHSSLPPPHELQRIPSPSSPVTEHQDHLALRPRNNDRRCYKLSFIVEESCPSSPEHESRRCSRLCTIERPLLLQPTVPLYDTVQYDVVSYPPSYGTTPDPSTNPDQGLSQNDCTARRTQSVPTLVGGTVPESGTYEAAPIPPGVTYPPPPVRYGAAQHNNVPLQAIIPTLYKGCFPSDVTNQVIREGYDPVAFGGFADIYRGILKHNGESIKVAIKAIKTYAGEDSNLHKKQKRLRREMKVWLNLRHVNVLPLLGITMGFGRFPAMVCPWVENGPLTKYLEDRYRNLSVIEILSVLKNVASGMQYLHSRSVVHGDLSGANVLIRGNGRACITDFGLSVVLSELGGSTFVTSRHALGTLRWTAPELLDLEVPEDDMDEELPHVVPTTLSDVYSFGSIMLQVLSGKVPYHYYKREEQVMLAMLRGVMPKKPNNALATERRWMFIQRCWSTVDIARSRPSIKEIVEFIEEELDDCRSRVIMTLPLEDVEDPWPCMHVTVEFSATRPQLPLDEAPAAAAAPVSGPPHIYCRPPPDDLSSKPPRARLPLEYFYQRPMGSVALAGGMCEAMAHLAYSEPRVRRDTSPPTGRHCDAPVSRFGSDEERA